VVLILQHEALEILFQRQVFRRVFGAGGWRFAFVVACICRIELGEAGQTEVDS